MFSYGSIIALERVQEILSPFRSPEELSIKTVECRAIDFPDIGEKTYDRRD